MLDKQVIQYTRDGIVKKDLATGESHLVAASDYAKELKHNLPQRENRYQSPYGHPERRGPPKGLDLTLNPTSHFTGIISHNVSSRKGCSPASSNSGSHGFHVSRRKSKAFKTRHFDFQKCFRQMLKKRRNMDDSQDDDNLGDQTVGAVYRQVGNLRSDIKYAKKYRRNHHLRTSQKVAKHVAKHGIKTSVAESKNVVGKVFSILKHPAMIKFFLIVAVVFVGMLLLCMLLGSTMGGFIGSATDHPELTSYVQQLDNDFPNKINSVVDTYEQKGYEVTVEGDESIFTDPGALAILATKEWTNIELTPANKSLLDKYHSILNYYTVTCYDESVTEGTSKTVVHHAIILIHSCTAEERIDAFGFDAKTKSSVLEMLNVLHQIENETGTGLASNGNISAAVLAYRSVVEQYCAQYNIRDYVNLVLAVMQQESGGSGKDPMQASECGYNKRFLHYPNSITDPSYSIQCGVEELAACLKAAKCKSSTDMQGISLALQGYNFGNGFISWAQQKGGYSLANAVAFSKMEAQKEGWSSYGDVSYVSHVLRYYNAIENGGSFIWPVTGYTDLSSGYGPRIDPTTGKKGSFHAGIDIPAPAGTPICAAASGTVIYAQFGAQPYGGYGNIVVIKNSASLVTLYGHCSKLLVSVGQTVQQGQKIALVGSTGDSTGNHCHFEVRVNGTHTDPIPYFQSRH